MTVSSDVLELAREAGRDLALRAQSSLTTTQAATAARDAGTIDYACQAEEVRRATDVVRTAASASFVKELAKMCGKAGAAGAAVDGAIGGFRAANYFRRGAIDGRQALKHVGAEAGCGFVTSSSGTAGTLAVFMVTGSMGPAALAAGMGASMGSRYLYKQAVGETLPDDEGRDAAADPRDGDVGGADPERAAGPPNAPDLEDIGPTARTDADHGSIDPIGPDDGDDDPPAGTDGDVGDSETPSDDSDAVGDDSSKSDDSDRGPNGGDVWESIGPNDA